MTHILTDRLSLRPFAENDAGFLLDVYSRWEVQRYIGKSPQVMTTFEQAQRKLARYMSPVDRSGLGYWAIALEPDGAPVGVLLIKDLPASGTGSPPRASGEIEIGWHVHPDFWGRGYAAEAGAAGLRHTRHHGIGRVLAVTHPENAASKAVARRIGMRSHGMTTRFYDVRCELFSSGPPAEAA